MNGGFAALAPPHMQPARGQVEVIPAQPDKLAGAQPMAISEQDGGGVTMALAVLPGSLHQPLDLAPGHVFAWALPCHCYIYCRWSVEIGLLIFHDFPPSRQ